MFIFSVFPVLYKSCVQILTEVKEGNYYYKMYFGFKK